MYFSIKINQPAFQKSINMKKLITYLMLVMFSCSLAYSQANPNKPDGKPNESIQQIYSQAMDNIIGFQKQYQGMNNLSVTQQFGNHNNSKISQSADPNVPMSNQTFNMQAGQSNEFTLGQTGSGNLLLSFQLGYLTALTASEHGNDFRIESSDNQTSWNSNKGFYIEGERNKINITQRGNKNGMLLMQQGTDNTISAEQSGSNNFLLAYQRGNNNSVMGYRQENNTYQRGNNNSVTGYRQENNTEDMLVETIVQIGENLTLTAEDASLSKPYGNTFKQTGTNLSLEINNGLLNSMGGAEIRQSGHDMKVIIEQSHFSFPMR